MVDNYNTVNLTLEQAKAIVGEAQNSARWGMKFASPPAALGQPPEGFWIGFQTADFPQEAVTYLEERIGNFPVSWIGEVTRNGSISVTNIETEKMEFTNYISKWINLMAEVTSKESTHKSVTTKDVEATVIMYLLDGKGNRTLEFTLKFCKPENLTPPSGANSPSVMSTGFGIKYDTFVRGK